MPTKAEPTKEELAKQLLQADFAAAAEANPGCKLCRLEGDDKAALLVLMKGKRDGGRPTFSAMTKMLGTLGIRSSVTAVNTHYREHWDGKDKKPKGR